jgi:hypothetical protein
MRFGRRARQLLITLAVLIASCDQSLPTCAEEQCSSQVSWKRTFQTAVNRKLDVLFVIDDTPAMAPHADALATGLADTAQRLLDARPKLSLHIGFVRAGTCDQTTRGGACNVATPEEFLRSEWCGTITNATGLADAFTCLGDLGASDCGPAQPLAAAAEALGPPVGPGWEGFLRQDASLMIVVVAATDDASGPSGSPAPVSSFVDSIKALKPDPSEILVSVVGPGDCAPSDVPSPRLAELANWFGANGLYIGLCNGQLPAAFDRVLDFMGDGLEPVCFRSVRDTDLARSGLQASCTLEDHVARDGTWTSASLPGCDAAGPPCWRLIRSDGPGCAGYILDVQRGADWCDEAGQNITVECLGCADATDPACAPPP